MVNPRNAETRRSAGLAPSHRGDWGDISDIITEFMALKRHFFNAIPNCHNVP